MGAASKKYEPSGNPGRGYPFIALIAIPGTILLSIVYGYICVYNPFAGKISFLIPIAYGVGVGYCVERAIIWGKCRSKSVVYGAGIAFGFVALYFGWASFLYGLLQNSGSSGQNPGLIDIMLSPIAICQTAASISSTGWYSVFGMTPTGIVLWIFWILEAAIIIFCTVAVPYTALQKVFCENCNQWCEAKEDIARFEIASDKAVMDRIGSGDLIALADLRMSPAASQNFLRVDTQRCKSCLDTATFAIKKVSIKKNAEGKLETDADDVCDPIVLTPEALKEFQMALARSATPASPAPGPEATPNAPA
jgi:hypothetical protein